MSAQQHLYRRGPIYWWRRVLELSPSVRCDIRLPPRTSVKAEARHRAGYLTALAGSKAMATVLDDAMTSEPDRVMTASELAVIYKGALDSALARFTYQQSMLPGEGVFNRQINEASADYYQWLIDTGGVAAAMTDAYAARVAARDYESERIDRLRITIDSHATSQPAVNPTTINRAVLTAGLPLNKTNYDIVRRQLWLAYRDAARTAETTRLHDADLGPPVNMGAFAPPYAPAAPAPVSATTDVPASTAPAAPPREQRTIEQARDACIAAARPDNGNWPSEVQVKTAIKLLIHVVGPNVFIDTLTQAHIGSVVDLMRALPNRWGRTADELSGGVAASLERAEKLPQEQLGIANATLAKHLTWLNKVVKYAERHGYGPSADLTFSGFNRDRREQKVRSRNLRPIWTKEEITQLLQAPIFTGCAGIRDVQRLDTGEHIIHDGWYFIPILLIHVGNRSSEVVGLPMKDVHENEEIPYFEVAPHDYHGVKNARSERKLPIHPELIRLRFLDYIKVIRDDGHEMLFPEFRSPNSKSFASTFYKKVFESWRGWAFPQGTEAKRVVGGAVLDKDVHSFRGRAATEMSDAGVAGNVVADILGHEHVTTTGKHYLNATPLGVMLDAMRHTTHLTASVATQPLNMRPKELRAFGATAGVGGRPKKIVVALALCQANEHAAGP